MTRAIVAGGVVQAPGRGGHVWAFLQWVLGLRRLGLDVLFVDRLGDRSRPGAGDVRPNCVEPSLGPGGGAMTAFRSVMERLDLADDFCVLLPGGGSVGLELPELERRCDGAILFNFMGFLDDARVLEAVGHRVFVDIDPGFPQMWAELGLADVLVGHDHFVTVGANLGTSDAAVPGCGRTWLATPPPVVLDNWPTTWVPDGDFRSVASWRGPFDPVSFGGTTYGLRAHEFRAFADLPRRTGGGLEVALDIDPADWPDRRRLLEGGWKLADPCTAAGDPWEYRRFIQSAGAEFSVAKGMYVHTNGGWFSDRSACFLASGKPVVTQETGWSAHYPDGDGLLSFEEPGGAVDAIEDVRRHYRHHALAARDLAETYFDSDRVLGRLLDLIG